jgi:hypothetical protein
MQWSTGAPGQEKFANPKHLGDSKQTNTVLSSSLKGKCCATACTAFGELQHVRNWNKALKAISEIVANMVTAREIAVRYMKDLSLWTETDAAVAAVDCLQSAIDNGSLTITVGRRTVSLQCNDDKDNLRSIMKGYSDWKDQHTPHGNRPAIKDYFPN